MVKAATIVDFAKRYWSSESIEARNYLSAIENLCSMQLGFKDVQMFFLKPQLNVLLNLVGLHYCISWLGVPVITLVNPVHCMLFNRINALFCVHSLTGLFAFDSRK